MESTPPIPSAPAKLPCKPPGSQAESSPVSPPDQYVTNSLSLFSKMGVLVPPLCPSAEEQAAQELPFPTPHPTDGHHQPLFAPKITLHRHSTFLQPQLPRVYPKLLRKPTPTARNSSREPCTVLPVGWEGREESSNLCLSTEQAQGDGCWPNTSLLTPRAGKASTEQVVEFPRQL